MRTLRWMWKKQKEFLSNFFKDTMDSKQKILWTRFQAEHVISEIVELLGLFPVKEHVLSDTPIDRELVKEELVDALKFWMNLCLIHGITPEEIVEKFKWKSALVELRYSQQLAMKSEKPRVFLDLDGVLFNINKALYCYLKDVHGLDYREVLEFKDYVVALSSNGFPSSRARRLKKEFEKSPYFSDPRFLDKKARSVVKKIRKKGYLVFILTSRDKREYHGVEISTFELLTRGKIPIDGIFFSHQKDRFLIDHSDHVALVVDDDPSLVGYLENLPEFRDKVVLLRQPYNEYISVKRAVNKLEEILDLLEG